ncbi:hypothetical protein M407DRAFT_240902 [Tulasnella calospora MUT 4182]|uniref:Uncharacterized protein n=1 Tax=Tulasnella calospora MUT 4182 TaxID=1051891 RepID=A0A0C3QLR1_9AGAM|nr:hypothetical protein M407DRAFT_240902 [Tulasnella calospora MUT 4182]
MLFTGPPASTCDGGILLSSHHRLHGTEPRHNRSDKFVRYPRESIAENAPSLVSVIQAIRKRDQAER